MTELCERTTMKNYDLKNITKTHFDAYSVNWEKRLGDSVYRDRFNVVKSMIKGTRLVDLGCGTGDYSVLSSDYIGIDNSLSMIEKAMILYPGKKFLVEDVEKTSLPDNFADCVIAIGLYEYLENPSILTDEIRRIAKNNGNAICAFQNKEKANIPVRILYRIYRSFRRNLLPKGHIKDKRIKHRKFTKSEVIGLFKGFEHVQTKYIHFNKVFISEFRCIKK